MHKPSSTKASRAEITVGGVNNLETRNAQCCKPEHTDEIAAYITGNRGITIHKRDCAYVLRLAEVRPERVLTAHWADPKTATQK
jgi:GTP pyrophosphokinase